MDSVSFKKFVFAFWIVRGLGDDSKCAQVWDALASANHVLACLQETKLSLLVAQKARSFLPSLLSAFCSVDADGSRGGITTAWDERSLSLSSAYPKTFSLTTVFTSTTTDLDFTVTNVYAPSDHGLTSSFIAEMVSLHDQVRGPWLVVGDFNLIRYPHEKNNDNFDRNLAALFNGLIRDVGWFELPLSDRLFTWSNQQENPVLARLDRAFFNSAWNDTIPNLALSSLPRPVSDHHPLVVAAATSIPNPSLFRFENS
jgi:hypothetical protein